MHEIVQVLCNAIALRVGCKHNSPNPSSKAKQKHPNKWGAKCFGADDRMCLFEQRENTSGGCRIGRREPKYMHEIVQVLCNAIALRVGNKHNSPNPSSKAKQKHPNKWGAKCFGADDRI